MIWMSSIQAQEYIVECIEALGSREFFGPFLEFTHRVLGVDQCMLFMLDSKIRMTCLISRNFQQESLATHLASAYIEGGHESDPNYITLSGLKAGETRAIHLRELLDSMPAAYRDQYFKHPGITDKVSLMSADGSHRYYLNLYRGAGRRTFLDEELFAAPAEARFLAALIRQHYRLNEALRREGPLAFLSERERQVCQGILAGKKMEAVAADVGIAVSSALTYRKRAYQKLGISSRSALFALCTD